VRVSVNESSGDKSLVHQLVVGLCLGLEHIQGLFVLVGLLRRQVCARFKHTVLTFQTVLSIIIIIFIRIFDHKTGGVFVVIQIQVL